jgi:hypothetical protein
MSIFASIRRFRETATFPAQFAQYLHQPGRTLEGLPTQPFCGTCLIVMFSSRLDILVNAFARGQNAPSGLWKF